MKKTHPKSFFEVFHWNSRMGVDILSPTPMRLGEEIDVLQIKHANDNYYLAEIVFKSDKNTKDITNET